MSEAQETPFEFDPATYLDLMRAELPAYDRLQAAVGAATAGVAVSSMLDLGTGTGETLARVLAQHPGATALAIDKNERMLAAAGRHLDHGRHEGRVANLTEPLPGGPFDLVTSCLAIHHLDGSQKADLFVRIAAVLRPGGRFVLGDVVIPDDTADAVTPLTGGHDQPSTLPDQLCWLSDAGFDAALAWTERDLVVVRADVGG
jgi:tRNA (cmo5U34)-methyltransferase